MSENRRKSMLEKSVPWVLFLALGVPIFTGLFCAIFASFGYFPVLGRSTLSLHVWQDVYSQPGFWQSIWLTIWTGLSATLISLALALALAANSPNFAPRLTSLFLATPHAAIAVALAFMIAPSGLLMRILGFETPPQISTPNDPYGLALILGLVVKEMPFLLLISLSAQNQIGATRHLALARSFGLHPMTAWLKTVLPMIYPLIRLPIFVVLAFGLSVVDMAQILGPSNPPTLAILAMRSFTAPDLDALMDVGVIAVTIALLTFSLILIWIGLERIFRHNFLSWCANGKKNSRTRNLITILSRFSKALMIFALIALLTLGIWSLSWRWPFPMLLPQEWSLKKWGAFSQWGEVFLDTAIIATASTALAVGLAILWLETTRARFTMWIYLPLILPQISFLFGLNLSFLFLGFSYTLPSVIWAHIFFVLPYILIALHDPWKQFDPRFLHVGASLRASAIKQLWHVKMPMLLRPILLASAIGFSVSVAQYLPTLFMGGGRISTLTTEAVALSSSGDRRIIAVYAILQITLPLLAFGMARAIPYWRFRDKKGMMTQI